MILSQQDAGPFARFAHAERRQNRSARPVESLAFFLENKMRSLELRALTLGTTDGRLIVGAGDHQEHVAEWGAIADCGKNTPDRVATWRLQMDGGEVLLTSWGGAFDPDLGDGVRRILGA